jgi:hypothetical protein
MSKKFREINSCIEYNLINVSKEISSFIFVYFTLNMKSSGFSEKPVLVHQTTGVLSQKIETFVEGQC